MQISIVIPCRNNLKYFKWAYDSIRKNQGDHEVFICAADDASTDGTRDYFDELSQKDDYFSYIVNEGPERVGHTILYDRIVNELVKTDVAIIFHADMYLCPGALDEIEKLLYEIDPSCGIEPSQIYKPRKFPNYKTIVSLTRIEPPLHPDGPEKYLADWGVEPELFDEDAFLQWFTSNGYKPKYSPPYTNGVFAPWAFFVKDFKEIGGHDPLYRPQSKEDSDIFNRFKLNGCTFVQTWIGCVYHMTCRGSRFNPMLTILGKNSSEWELHNIKSARNFIRKWGHFVRHDEFMNPIIPHRYDIGIVVEHCTVEFLKIIEPWGQKIYTDISPVSYDMYIKTEDTFFDLKSKLKHINDPDKETHDVTVYIDRNRFTNEDFINIQWLSDILTDSGRPHSDMTLGNLHIITGDLQPTENQLIKL